MSDSSVNDHQIDSQGGDGVTVEGRGGDVGLAGGEGIVSESVVRAEGVGGGGVSLVMPLLRVRTMSWTMTLLSALSATGPGVL